jgi:glutathione S-transferase
VAKELGLAYEHVKVDFATGETHTPAHLALNPNGHIPVIEDHGFVLWESMAIYLYLSRGHPSRKTAEWLKTVPSARLRAPPGSCSGSRGAMQRFSDGR